MKACQRDGDDDEVTRVEFIIGTIDKGDDNDDVKLLLDDRFCVLARCSLGHLSCCVSEEIFN